jgi:hypothetical protein
VNLKAGLYDLEKRKFLTPTGTGTLTPRYNRNEKNKNNKTKRINQKYKNKQSRSRDPRSVRLLDLNASVSFHVYEQ